MPKPTTVEIALKKPGDVIHEPEGDYTVNPDGVTADLVPKATTAESPPKVAQPTSGTNLQQLQERRSGLEARYNDPNTPDVEKTNIGHEIDTINSQIKGASAPAVVAKGSSVITGYDENGKPIMSGQTTYPVSAGGSVVTIGADGKPGFSQAPNKPDTPAEAGHAAAAQTSAGAAVTSSQAQLIQAKVKELADNHDMNEADKKAAFDTWWKINIELPNTEETQAIARQTYASGQADKAVARATTQARVDQYNNPGNLDALHNIFASRGLAAPPAQDMRLNMPDLDSVASQASMKALAGISPTANRIWNAPAQALPATLPGSQGPASPAGATPITDAVTGVPGGGLQVGPQQPPVQDPNQPAGSIAPAVLAAFLRQYQGPMGQAAA